MATATMAAPAAPAVWKPHHNPWAVALTVTLATFMEVLDTSIANVALPHMAGTLGASQEEHRSERPRGRDGEEEIDQPLHSARITSRVSGMGRAGREWRRRENSECGA